MRSRRSRTGPAGSDPLRAALVADGARWTEWNGAPWAANFGDPVGEHHAVRSAVGVWDISALHTWEIRGPGAADAVDRLFTNSVADAAPGTVRYGLLGDVHGLVINDATVYVLAADEVWVITSRATDRRHLVDGAPVREIGRRRAALQLQGPDSRALLGRLGADVAELGYLRFLERPVDVAGIPCWISRVGYSGELGYELFCDRGEAGRLWRALRDQGARPYGLDAVHTLRIEAGLLMVGEDFDPGRTRAADLSLDPVVRPGAGFRGADAIRRDLAGPRQAVVTLRVHVDAVPTRGAIVRGPERPIGSVTSACRSPTLGGVLALASVAAKAATPGVAVTIGTGAGPAAATIAPTPVYDTAKHRRRG